jgi:hypothetical protein
MVPSQDRNGGVAASDAALRIPEIEATEAAICPPVIPIVDSVASARPSHAIEAASQVAPVEPVSMTAAFSSGGEAPHG